MAYVTLYLRWRPQDFDTLVGQQPIKQALSNALTTGRIAHAYLFTGPRGTGKTTTARIFAKALNCEHGPTAKPCGVCDNCRQITSGTSMDVQELDAASNRGVEDIKNLNKNADFAPVNCRYKVYIIDEAHMLTTEACNALLKTLEEPPSHVVFILATTEPQKILPTIHSRCQRFDFHPLTQVEIVEHLRKVAAGSDIKADDEALQLIAAASEGGMRDALSLLEQCGVMADTVTGETVRSVRGIVGREILRQLMAAVGQGQPAPALEIFAKLLEQGKDIAQILLEIEEYLRSLLLFQEAPEYQQIYVTDTAAAFAQLAPLFPPERILAAQEVLHQALGDLRFLARGRIVAEMCLCDLCKVKGDSVTALKARVAALEKQLAGGVSIPVAPVFTEPVPKVEAAAPKAAPIATPVFKAPAAEFKNPAAAPQTAESKTSPVASKATAGKVIPAEHTVTSFADFGETEGTFMSGEHEEPQIVDFSTVHGEDYEAAPAVKSAPATTASKSASAPVVKVAPAPAVKAVPAKAVPKSAPVPAPVHRAMPEAQVTTVPEEKASYTPYSGDWATGDEYWTEAKKLLRGEGKTAMSACGDTGKVLAFEKNNLVLGFKNSFTCKRMQEQDYCHAFEDALLRISRRTIKITCVMEEKKTSAPKKKQVISKAAVVPESELGPSAKKAAQYFDEPFYWAEGHKPEKI